MSTDGIADEAAAQAEVNARILQRVGVVSITRDGACEQFVPAKLFLAEHDRAGGLHRTLALIADDLYRAFGRGHRVTRELESHGITRELALAVVDVATQVRAERIARDLNQAAYGQDQP